MAEYVLRIARQHLLFHVEYHEGELQAEDGLCIRKIQAGHLHDSVYPVLQRVIVQVHFL